MTWDPRPLPEVTPESRPFWEGASEGSFKIQECNDCGFTYYYPRAQCPECWSENVVWKEAKGTGEIYTYSIAQDMNGWSSEFLPLILAYVELEEGPRVMSNIVDADPDQIGVGDPVEVTFVETNDGDIAIPVFKPL